MRFKFALKMAISTIVALESVFLMTMEMQICTGWLKFAMEMAMVFPMIIAIQRFIL